MTKFKRKTESITGCIDMEARVSMSKKGTPYTKFVVRTKTSQLVICFLFSNAEKFCSLAKTSTPINFVGYKNDDGNFIVESFHIPELELTVRRGSETDGKARREERQRLEDKGLVPVIRDRRRGTEWLPREQCLLVGKKWVEKIEYAMDLIGPTEVTKRLKEAGFNCVGIIKKRAEYLKFIEGIIAEAEF